MTCPICDQKPMNCDCTPREREMWRELRELDDRPAIVITDAEREAIGRAADRAWRDGYEEDVNALRGLLSRCAIGHQ